MKKLLFFALIITTLSACSSSITEEIAESTPIQNKVSLTDAQFKNANIELGKIEKRTLSTVLKLNGKIDVPPQNMVSVSMPLGGFLKSTSLLPGMHVKKGDIIATMEDQQYILLQQEYLTAKTKLTFLDNEYHRQKELNLSKASSDKVFQQSEMDYKSQKIVVSALAEKLRLINIYPEKLDESTLSRSVNLYSSIDGFVSKVNVNIGKYVNPSDILFELINPEDIHLNLKVFEKDLNKLSIGQTLMAFNNNQPDKKHPCVIILISQDLSADRSAEVHCHFEDYDKNLLPGMYMNANIEINSTAAASSVPDEAIVAHDGKDFVFACTSKNNFEMIEIQKGSTENNFTEITGMAGRDLAQFKIVVKGAYSLLMQLKNTSEE